MAKERRGKGMKSDWQLANVRRAKNPNSSFDVQPRATAATAERIGNVTELSQVTATLFEDLPEEFNSPDTVRRIDIDHSSGRVVIHGYWLNGVLQMCFSMTDE